MKHFRRSIGIRISSMLARSTSHRLRKSRVAMLTWGVGSGLRMLRLGTQFSLPQHVRKFFCFRFRQQYFQLSSTPTGHVLDRFLRRHFLPPLHIQAHDFAYSLTTFAVEMMIRTPDSSSGSDCWIHGRVYPYNWIFHKHPIGRNNTTSSACPSTTAFTTISRLGARRNQS